MTVGLLVGSIELTPQITSAELNELEEEYHLRLDLEGRAIEIYSRYFPQEMLVEGIEGLSISALKCITDTSTFDVKRHWQHIFDDVV